MTGADLATTAHVDAIMTEFRRLNERLDALEQALPPKMISVRAAADAMDVDPQTVVAMLDRGDLVGRRAGRRRLVDVASMRRAPR